MLVDKKFHQTFFELLRKKHYDVLLFRIHGMSMRQFNDSLISISCNRGKRLQVKHIFVIENFQFGNKLNCFYNFSFYTSIFNP